jgi:hypothetical protein
MSTSAGTLRVAEPASTCQLGAALAQKRKDCPLPGSAKNLVKGQNRKYFVTPFRIRAKYFAKVND